MLSTLFNPTPCFRMTRINIVVPLHLRLPSWSPFMFPNENFVCICDVWLAYLFPERVSAEMSPASPPPPLPPSRTDTKGPFTVSYFVKNE